MKRLLVLTVVAISAASMIGCNCSWLRRDRGDACGVPAGCESPTIMQGTETYISPGVTTPTPGMFPAPYTRPGDWCTVDDFTGNHHSGIIC